MSVSVEGIRGAQGSDVAVILFTDPAGLLHGEPVTDESEPLTGIAGFGVPVDADPFTVARTLQDDSPLDEPLPSSGTPASVPAGDYTLVVFVSSDLGPYGEWMPSAPVEAGCLLDVTVTGGRTTEVRVPSVPPWDIRKIPACPAA